MHAVKSRAAFSKSDLASEFGIDRRRVDKLLEGIPTNGPLQRGYPTYYIADVAQVLSNYAAKGSTGGNPDGEVVGLGPDDLHPDRLDTKSRKEWYDGEKVRKALLKEDGDLVPVDDVRDALAAVFKTVKAFLLTLADVLERDAGLPSAAVARVVKLCDKLCDKLADELSNTDVR